MSEEFDPYRKWLGIPPKDQPPNHYRLLGIALFESDPDVIHHAGDRQMTHLRTFQSGPHGDLSQKLLNEVSAARVCLLKPEQKAAYDAQLKRELAPPVSEAAAPPVSPPPPPSTPPVQPKRVAEEPAFGSTPVVKTRSVPRGRSYAKSRKKSSPLPLIVGILAIGGLGIGIMLVMLLGGGEAAPKSSGNASTSPAAQPRTKPLSQYAPAKPLRPRDKPRNRPQPPADPPAMEEPAEEGGGFFANNPVDSPPLLTPEELEANAVQETFDEIREAFANRDLSRSKRLLSNLKDQAESQGKLEEYEHLGVLQVYLTSFWSDGVRPAVHRNMEPGESFEHADHSVTLVGIDEDTSAVTYQFDGTEATADSRELPTLAAVTFAWRGFLGRDPEDATVDPFCNIYTAAFVLFDTESELPRSERIELAKNYLREGSAAGDTYVAKEIEHLEATATD